MSKIALQDYTLNCANCGGWFSEDTAPRRELVERDDEVVEVFYCSCKDHPMLTDAIAAGIPTPWDVARADVYKIELAQLNERVEKVEGIIKQLLRK